MKKFAFTAALLTCAAVLAGCGAASPQALAEEACGDAIREDIGADFESDLTAENMSEALFETGIKDEMPTDGADALWSLAGEIRWAEGGVTKKTSVVCLYDGEKDEANLILS